MGMRRHRQLRATLAQLRATLAQIRATLGRRCWRTWQNFRVTAASSDYGSIFGTGLAKKMFLVSEPENPRPDLRITASALTRRIVFTGLPAMYSRTTSRSPTLMLA
eukprot:666217-Prymnesium_polylepis.1